MAAVKQQRTSLQALGLALGPNGLAQQDGALEEATNVVCRHAGVFERRRGLPPLHDALGGAVVESVTELGGTLLARDNTKLYRDSGSSWTQVGGAVFDPSGAIAARYIEDGSLFFTSSVGIQRLDDSAGDFERAGVAEPSFIKVALTGSDGVLADGDTVAYRIRFGYRGVNDRLILGPPSGRIVVANDAGGPRTPRLQYNTSWLKAGRFIQVYRTLASSTGDPGDEMFLAYELVYEADPASTQENLDDKTPEVLLGAALETNVTVDGIAQASHRPPLARDLTQYNQMVFAADTSIEHSVTPQLVDVTDETGLDYFDLTGDTSLGSAVITNCTVATGDRGTSVTVAALRVGMVIKSTLFPAATFITAINTGAGSIQLSANATLGFVGHSLTAHDWVEINTTFGSDTVRFLVDAIDGALSFTIDKSGTVSQNIEGAAQRLCQAVNFNATSFLATYEASSDDIPGKFRVACKDVPNPSFNRPFALTSSHPTAFSPPLYTDTSSVLLADQTLKSTDDARRNRIMISRLLQPEAFPRGQFIDVGSSNQPITRIMANRDSLFVLKPDGVFVVQGFDPANLTVRPLDLGVSIPNNQANAVALLGDAIYARAARGLVRITAAGVQPISGAIQAAVDGVDLDTQTWMAASEADQELYWGPGDSTFYVLNLRTGIWTRHEVGSDNLTYGYVSRDRKLYLGDSSGVIRQQLRTGTDVDFADASEAVTVSSASGTAVALSGSPTASGSGWWLVQGAVSQEVTDFSGADLTVAAASAFSAGAATLYKAIDVALTTLPLVCDKPGVLKRFDELLFFQDSAIDTYTVATRSDWSGGAFQTLIITPIDAQDRHFLRCLVAQEACAGSWLQVRFQLSQPARAWSHNGFALTYRPMGMRVPA